MIGWINKIFRTGIVVGKIFRYISLGFLYMAGRGLNL